jgi:hypothetical protein
MDTDLKGIDAVEYIKALRERLPNNSSPHSWGF